jgi:hypothetical protein
MIPNTCKLAKSGDQHGDNHDPPDSSEKAQQNGAGVRGKQYTRTPLLVMRPRADWVYSDVHAFDIANEPPVFNCTRARTVK